MLIDYGNPNLYAIVEKFDFPDDEFLFCLKHIPIVETIKVTDGLNNRLFVYYPKQNALKLFDYKKSPGYEPQQIYIYYKFYKGQSHKMTLGRAIELLKIEKECITRADTCDRDCSKCDIVQDADELLDMYSFVIEELTRKVVHNG